MRFALLAVPALAALAVAAACTGPNLDNQLFRCDSNADCSAGQVCSTPTTGLRTCVSSTDAGIDSGPEDTTPIRIGMPTVLQGANADLGVQMKRGVEAWFKQVNAKGGIKGKRPVSLVPVNDNYDPATAVTAMSQLLDIQGTALSSSCATSLNPPDCILEQADTLGPNRVTSILGQVGTPTMVVSAPICIRDQVVYFAPFTGAQRFLRDGSQISPVIFNYRAGYYEEAAAFVDYFYRTVSPPVADVSHVLGFAQNDTFGDAGYDGFTVAYSQKIAPIQSGAVKRINYTRGDLTSVNQSVTDAQTYIQPLVNAAKVSNQPFTFGIFMVATTDPASKFIHDMKTWVNADPDRARLLKLVFMNVSFVGGDGLVQELAAQGTYVETGTNATKYFGDGVWVTQVVPYYRSSLPGVVSYRSDIAAYDQGTNTWGSLEGYFAAKLFTEGLERATGYDTTSMVNAYESMGTFDLGTGATMGFSHALPDGHQASHQVWLSLAHFDNTQPTGYFDIPWIWKGPVTADNQIHTP